ncbi:MAG: autotransporter domain-containing protein [Pseudomonadota bacterium]
MQMGFRVIRGLLGPLTGCAVAFSACWASAQITPVTLQQYLLNISFLAPGESVTNISCTGASSGTATAGTSSGNINITFNATPQTISECVGSGGGGSTFVIGLDGGRLGNAADTAVQQATQLNANRLLRDVPRPATQPIVEQAVLPLFAEFLRLERERRALLNRIREQLGAGDDPAASGGFDPRELAEAERRANLAERKVALLEDRINDQQRDVASVDTPPEFTPEQLEGLKRELEERRAEAVAANAEFERLEELQEQSGGIFGNFSDADRAELTSNADRFDQIDARQSEILNTIKQRVPGSDGERITNFLQGTKDAADRRFDSSGLDDAATRVAGLPAGVMTRMTTGAATGVIGRDIGTNGLKISLSDLGGPSAAFSQGINGDLDAALLRAFQAQRFDVWASVEGTGFTDDAGQGTDGTGFSIGLGASYAVTNTLSLGLVARYRNVQSDGLGQTYDGEFLSLGALAGLSLPHGVEVDGLLLYERGVNDLRIGGGTSGFTTDTVALAVEASTDLFWDQITLTPRAGLSHAWTMRESFTDSLGNLATASTITQGLATIGASASTFIPIEDTLLLGLAPSVDLSGLAEFNRDPGGNRGGGTVLGTLELIFVDDARLSLSSGYTVLGGFQAWTFGVTGTIPF